ncbi:hypothetical protein SISNIDRAFT_454762, partial [Sistotremastrum niveocremeum HHB9708]
MIKIRPLLKSARTYATRRPERPPLKIKDPLMGPGASQHSLDGGKFTFIHRKPPTAPSPHSYITAPVSPLLRPPSQPSAVSSPSPLPPLQRPELPKHNVLSEAQIDEIRRLRAEDPQKNTASQLARQFGCSSKFVSFCAPLPRELKKAALAEREAAHAQSRERWGEKKRTVAAIRQKRRSMW